MDVVRAEVSSSGGRIDIESKAGKGTRIVIHLPVSLAVSQIVLLGAGKLPPGRARLDLTDESQFLVHPRTAGHGPPLYQGGLPGTRRLELVSAKPLRCGAVAMHYRRILCQ